MAETILCTLFDGEKVVEHAAVTLDGGIITGISITEKAEKTPLFLMPGLIDSHTHMGTWEQIDAMLQSGITATCDVSASKDLIAQSNQLKIVSSAGMAMGVVLSGRHYVEKAAADGAQYIKVLLFNTHSIGKSALGSIVSTAHEKGLKVAVHATEVATARQAVTAGADILLHVPMKEPFPQALAQEIAEKGIAVAPTLVMMETFANSGRNGYRKEHYANARAAVKLLHETGVKILAATDANPGNFAPELAYGTSIHRELELLVQAGLTPLEVLSAATRCNAEVFGIQDAGTIAVGKPANMVLMEGRPDKCITDSAKILQVWTDGKPIVKKGSTL